ncbi:MAG TPA: HAMP domain-containing sensor histidine kinase [Jatrophihabitans sp.]|nr:HAMP domain-containing sensor histidine kinase [Jatrophihabitans sp.]
MTRRILAGFLGVLVLVIVAVVVPLGFIVTRQQSNDFKAEARSAVHAVSAVAEEHIDDKTPLTGLETVVARFAARGDRVVVLDRDGRLVVRGGTPVAASVTAAAAAARPLPDTPDAVTETAPIGDADRRLGTTVLVRDAEPLHHRQALVWLTLLAAGAGTLAIGGLVGWSLSRWIGRPLVSLTDAAHGIGGGDQAARADLRTGPPQVRDVATAFNDMADRVAELLEAQRGMTADVSHQLRTPLAALRLRLELLAADLDANQAEEVASMIDETNRLARLVDGLLAVARAETRPPAPAPSDVAELTAGRVGAWRPIAAERGVELCLRAQPAVASVTPGHAEQILDNLLANAIDALVVGGRIDVEVAPSERGVVVTVADNGPGMPAERRARALDRFVTDRAGEGGSGLGLAIVSRLVSADHGSAALSETPGGGLTVAITFPSGDQQARTVV